ncbi:MAG: hypothetical protein J6Z11_08045 [Candidatus Riflebacteria bacterium]|nr:hypothetical protein [Candidatus Riflebacteria bacterium]
MALFSFANPEQKVKERTDFIKALSAHLNAEYYNVIDAVAEFFNFSYYRDLSNCNIIVGNIEGFDYCFVEYFHVGRGKNDHSKWISELSFRMQKDIPDFQLITKDSAKRNAGCFIIFGLIFFIPVVVTIIASIVAGTSLLSGKNEAGFLSYIFIGVYVLVALLFTIIPSFLIYSGIKTLKEINNQRKYNIMNPNFNEKYAIFTDSDTDTYKISKIFNYDFCSKVLNFEPELTEITFDKNCVKKEYDSTQLTLAFCENELKTFLNKAKLFEEREETF